MPWRGAFMMALLPASPDEIMRVFDELPQRLRLAIAFADFPFDPRDISRRIEQGSHPAKVARTIEKRRTLA